MLHTTTHRSLRTLGKIFFSLVLGLVLFPAASTARIACQPALPVDTVFRTSEASAVLRIDVPSTGVLSLEFSRPGRLEIISDACGNLPTHVLVVERSDQHLMLAAEHAGVLSLRVSPRDSSPAGFSAVGDFQSARRVVEHLELDGMPARRTSFFAADPSSPRPATKAEPEHADADPDGVWIEGTPALATFWTAEVTLLANAEPEHADADPDGLVHPGMSSD